MVFSETLESVHKLREELQHKRRIKSYVIESKLKANERQEILSKWGVEFYPLLSVHTLEIGYDVPEVGVAIILANTSNINQTIQRIGRVIRKSDGKEVGIHLRNISYWNNRSSNFKNCQTCNGNGSR